MYSSNNSYMQDLYYYNQVPNANTYIPYYPNTMNGNFNQPIPSNQDMGFYNNMYSNQNIPNMNMVMRPPVSNINTCSDPNNLYPSTYRIVNPVVERVVSGTNTQCLTENSLNNMVDTVFNIVEGQVDINTQNSEENIPPEISQTPNSSSTTTPTRTTAAQDTKNISNTNSNFNNTNNPQIFKNDTVFRDLIKILILNEIIRKRQSNSNYMPRYF